MCSTCPWMPRVNDLGVLVYLAALGIAVNVSILVAEEMLHPWLSLSHLPSLIGCLATWCPCLAHAQNRRRVDHLNTQGYPDPRRNDIVAGDSVLYAVLDVMWDMGWVLQVRGVSLSVCICILSSSTSTFRWLYSDASIFLFRSLHARVFVNVTTFKAVVLAMPVCHSVAHHAI